jgi:tetratricopeptide (TPR) repeat protein
VDVVRTLGVSTDLAAGLEVAPHPLLALRFGMNEGDFTAGTGVRWNLYSFDYSMQETRFDTVHRFGLTMQFGSTVNERRLAARRAEEEHFRERLASSFAEREAERVEELLRQAQAALATGNLDDALERVATVVALDPAHAGARAVEANALRAKASRAESSGQLAEATLLWARVLAVAPDDAEAETGLARCRAEGDLRATRTARIRDLFGTGLDAFTGVSEKTIQKKSAYPQWLILKITIYTSSL